MSSEVRWAGREKLCEMFIAGCTWMRATALCNELGLNNKDYEFARAWAVNKLKGLGENEQAKTNWAATTGYPRQTG